ncbi:armadillo-type protein [Lentinula aciculospora]|uniref:Armadillo-type protein n=1 Tax=Lentinula aciculospora TaxID=153920 RepID=A0A9W9AS31_9AGAR|nr:armadillo-type protein [Lentinula aciculospora]
MDGERTSDDEDLMDVDVAPPVARFKYKSYNAQLKDIHLPTALSAHSNLDGEIEDTQSHFFEALLHWQELNLSPSFIKFSQKSTSLSSNLPLLLHNWHDIVNLWLEAEAASDDEGLKALLDLLQKIAQDLRLTLAPVYSQLLDRLLQLSVRSIPSQVLTVLLSTLSSLFKYLLVPSTDSTLLEQTWTAFRTTLPKCVPEIQRALAEVWGSVLRRLNTVFRSKVVVLLAEDLENIADAAAWCLVSACKSVSQTLHTVTPSLISPLIEFYLSCMDSDSSYTLIRRVLTAFIHHVKGPDQFSSIAEIIIKQYTQISSLDFEAEDGHEEKLRRILEIAAVPASVRNGSRLASTSITQLYTLSMKIPVPVSATSHSAMLKFISALLLAGDLSLWMSSGRNLIARLWNDGSQLDSKFSLELHGVLVEMKWGGWKSLALPGLLKRTGRLLEVEPSYTLRLIASLCRDGKLGDADFVWKKKITEWVSGRLEDMIQSEVCSGFDEEKGAALYDVLAFATFFSPDISRSLAIFANKYIRCIPTAFEKKVNTFPHSAWIINICLRCLAKRPAAEWAEHVDMMQWMQLGVENWSWSRHVLEALVEIAAVRDLSSTALPFKKTYHSLENAILSHSHSLRLSALRLLASPVVNAPPDTLEVVERCLQGEQISLDVQGVRERVVKIGRVVQVVKQDDELGADLCARWLTAQLKVNLRPVWSPAATALFDLSQRFGDIAWSVLFTELKMLSVGEGSSSSHLEQKQIKVRDPKDGAGSNVDDPWEEERSWRDPSAHKLRETVIHWQDVKLHWRKILQDSGENDRLDKRSYENQILHALEECHMLAEKHNRELILLFLDITGPVTEPKLPRAKLAVWLSLFSKFFNPKALYATESLQSLYITLLSHPDRTLQSSALSCLLTYKQRSLSLYENKFRALLDDTRWRDELTSLDISAIEPQNREVVDVVIRLLFGMMLEKKGRSRGADRRSAVLTALAGCTDDELALLVDLMLRPLTEVQGLKQGGPVIQRTSTEVSDRQSVGFLTLLGDVLKNLGSRLVKYWDALLGTTMDIIAKAQGRIDGDESEAGVGDTEEEDVPLPTSKLLRSIRQLGLKRLADFFRCRVEFDFAPYMRAAFTAFITPRIPLLDKENTQAPSALLELFHVWTLNSDQVYFLVQFDEQVVPKIFSCLTATNVKPAVISRIFDIVDRLIAFSADSEKILENILRPNVSLLLTNLSVLVKRSKSVTSISTPLGQRQVGILSQIAQYSTDAEEAITLLQLFSPLLHRPSKVVPEKIKTDLLKILGHQMRLIPDLQNTTSEVYRQLYELLSMLFQSLRWRQARSSLVSAFHDLSNIQSSLQDLAQLMEDLNAYSTKRLDEPDFERRLGAFARLNDSLYRSLSNSDWLPVLYNMLSFIQDPEELAVRNHASFSMRHFVDLVASQTSVEHDRTFSHVLFPGLKNGLRSKNEMVRIEVLGVIAYAVEKCENVNSLQNMRILLANGDEEANFFNNINHVQLHRRSRALRRLADQCDEQPLRNSTLTDIIIPLISNYIVETSSLDHHLVNDSINATGRLAKHLSWKSYYALVQRYLRLSKVKDERERVYIRTIVAILENFPFSMQEEVRENENVSFVGDAEAADIEMGEADSIEPGSKSTNQIADAVNLHLLPTLLTYLESRDSTTEDTTRIPIAVGVVKVARNLPLASAQLQITRLLTTTSQILRSKSHETRDLTRDTLCRIAVVLGADHLALIIRELRAALLRGPHLHILATTVHHLLVHVTNGEHVEDFGVLDNCVPDIAFVSSEVIFGESGKDVQAEGFKTKLREVKASSSKGLNSFHITAKHITASRINALLLPLRDIMRETESMKVMQAVDEVLKHIASGLNSNTHISPADILSLCHTLITQNSRFLQQAAPRRNHLVKGDAIVQTKRQIAIHTDHFANNSFRFVVFGLDLLNTALRRNRFNFQDTSVMSRLESMIVAVGNTLYSTSSPVLISGLKTVAGLVKCPLKTLGRSLPLYIRQTLDILKQIGTTESEVAQTALKTLSTIFRDGPAIDVKEKDLTFLLEIVTPDLEEPSRQNSVFAILRAVVARKFVVPEIYDIMDKVSEIMVTNQSAQVQELCRSVLLQFLLDYPQGKGRLRNQMLFLTKNLAYEYESGRKSVMEILGAIISKFQTNLIQEYSDLLFVALVMAIANDDSTKCREMAAHLVKVLISRLDQRKQTEIMSHLHTWSSQRTQTPLVRVSAQVYGLTVDALQNEIVPFTVCILKDVRASLEYSAEQLESFDDDSIDINLGWQLPYHSLTTLAKLVKVFPEVVTDSQEIDWNLVVNHLLFPHAWVRTASSRLLGTLFSSSTIQTPPTFELSTPFAPLSSSGMKAVAQKLCQQLKSEHLDDTLSLQTVKNLFFIGRCYATIPFTTDSVGDITQGKTFEDDELLGEEHITVSQHDHPLPWMFSKLSYQMRSALIAKRKYPSGRPNWFHQPVAVIRWFAAMTSFLDAAVLERFLVHILSPIYRLIEDDTIRDPKMTEMKDNAVELRDLVQSKVGTTKFSTVYNQIRQNVVALQRERREAKILHIATNPQAAASRKAHKNITKKDSRKRKNQTFVDGKGKLKKRREE